MTEKGEQVTIYHDYEDRCAFATTDQGLDPIIAHLKQNGIKAVVDQTGGFCMCVGVYATDTDERHVWVTSGDGWNGEGGWLVCGYDYSTGEVADEDGNLLGENVGTDEVIPLVRQWLGDKTPTEESEPTEEILVHLNVSVPTRLIEAEGDDASDFKTLARLAQQQIEVDKRPWTDYIVGGDFA